jgi:hypothetical protein
MVDKCASLFIPLRPLASKLWLTEIGPEFCSVFCQINRILQLLTGDHVNFYLFSDCIYSNETISSLFTSITKQSKYHQGILLYYILLRWILLILLRTKFIKSS